MGHALQTDIYSERRILSPPFVNDETVHWNQGMCQAETSSALCSCNVNNVCLTALCAVCFLLLSETESSFILYVTVSFYGTLLLVCFLWIYFKSSLFSFPVFPESCATYFVNCQVYWKIDKGNWSHSFMMQSCPSPRQWFIYLLYCSVLLCCFL